MRFSALLPLGFFALGTVACATASRSVTELPADPNKPTSDAAETNPTDPDAPQPPHALGTIVLGESRAAGTGQSYPVILASFLPDAKKKSACTRSVGGCEVTDTPTCKTGTAQGCATGEACTFDDSCVAKCVKSCTKSCAASEECYFSSAAEAADQGMACRKRERFDAGAIAFSGTTTAITLFPPYAIKPEGNGAPFMAQSEIRVQASGAANAGFEKFDEKFTSTTFLESDPPLSELPKSTLFGTGNVTVGWVPGNDLVTITVSGVAASAACKADDKTGTFDIPRTVIKAVTGSDTSTTTPSVAISVGRERHEIKKGKKTTGTLTGADVQSEGWLELVTTSSESYSYQACSSGYTLCGETCTVLTSDVKNCGACGKACLTTQYCSAGKCY